MRGILILALATGLLTGGCGGGEAGDTTATTTPAVTTTASIPATTKEPPPTTTTTMPMATTTTRAPTSTTTQPTEEPVIYWYGETGLTRIANGEETQLELKPVMWAVDDLMGGVIYRLDWRLDAETTYWLKADGSLETMVYEPGFVAVIDGAPTAAMVVESVSGEEQVDVLLVDLRSGRERRLTNVGFAGDGWSFPRSFGGGIFVGVDGAAVGCGGSDAVVAFWDEDGRRIDHPHNPVREPCGPCELSAVIAPDGRLLAYGHRADAPSEYHGRLVCGGHDDWWEETQDVLGEVVVLDLETGEAVFRLDAQPQARVADFDGRYVVVASGAWDPGQPIATIHDTWGEEPPVTVSGSAILARPPLSETAASLRADGLGALRFGEEAERAEEILADQFGPPSSVWEYDATGRDDPGCHVATGYRCDKHLRLLSWAQMGLAVVLTDASPYRDDAVPHFAGWSFGEAPTRNRLTTPEGVAIGTTIADLTAAYGDDLEISPWLDECAHEDSWEFAARGIRGSLSGPPESPTTAVTALESGVRSSC